MPRAFELPGFRKLQLFLVLSVVLVAEFMLVYGGMNWLTSQRNSAYQLYFDWELSIPLIPWMVYFYFSLNLLTALSLLVLSEQEIKRYAQGLGAAILGAGIIFWVVPTKLGFVRLDPVPGYEEIFRRLHAWDLPHNCFPSLHITLSALSVRVMMVRARPWFRGLLIFWMSLIAASVLLVHQHHLIDIAGGLLLAEACYRYVFLRKAVP
jgi:membrane-associated phospholipid phosphatase